MCKDISKLKCLKNLIRKGILFSHLYYCCSSDSFSDFLDFTGSRNHIGFEDQKTLSISILLMDLEIILLLS